MRRTTEITCKICTRQIQAIAEAAAVEYEFGQDPESLLILTDRLLETATPRDLFFRRIVLAHISLTREMAHG